MPIVRKWSSRSDADAEAYLIANNRTSERGGWLDEMLVDALGDIAGADPGLLVAVGYTEEELDDLKAALDLDQSLGPAAPDDEEGQDDDEEELPERGDAPETERSAVWGVVVTCENEDQQVELLERLTKQGYKVWALM
ncbi:hypothetical protein GCM10022226_74200 [Sphaerisporangium flaviroseum]|uniref:Uncharacterized protein n=1 Tax=Sphaerisporangium flaviroseum TaxID=509199 RepID=A0ABP7JDD4_9ACTN